MGHLTLYRADMTPAAWETERFSSGLGRLPDAREPRTHRVINGDWSFTMLYPLNGTNASEIVQDRLICAEGQLYRINGIQKEDVGAGRMLRVDAEHIFYDLRNSEIVNIETAENPETENGVTQEDALGLILAGTGFSVGTVNTGSGLNHLDILQKSHFWALKEQVLTLWGGELFPDNWTIHILSPCGLDRKFPIRRGRNLKGIKYKESVKDTITRLHVTGYEGATFEEINDGRDYIDSPNISLYHAPKEGRVSFDDIDDPSELLSEAEAYLPTVDIPQVEYDLDLLFLKRSAFWSLYAPLEECNLGDTISIHHDFFALDIPARAMEAERDPVREFTVRVVIGNYTNKLISTLSEAKAAADLLSIVAGADGTLKAGRLRGTIDLLTTVDIGQTIRLQNIIAQNAGYTHKVKWKLLGAGEQVQNLAAGITYTDFTLPASWFSLLPSATSGAATCTLETYDGTTLLGSNTYSFTATVNASVIPSITGLTAAPYSDTLPAVPAGWNMYVKSKSKATISATIAAGTGASIQTVKVEGAGFTGWALPYTTGLLTTVGDFTFTVTVTDTRGRQKVLTVGITVTNYASPSASGVAFSRAATNGCAPDLNGTYIRGIATLAFTAIGANTLTVKAYYRQMGTTTWYPAGGTMVVSATAYWMGGGGINVAYPYEVKLVLADALTTIEIAGVIPTALRFWDFRADRAALGRFASNTKQFALPDDWDILHKGQTLDQRFAPISHAHNASDINGAIGKAKGLENDTSYAPYITKTYIAYDSYAGYEGWASHLHFNHGDNTYYQDLMMPYWTPPRYSRLEGGVFKGPYVFYSTENISAGSATPSGGSDGDIYFKTS